MPITSWSTTAASNNSAVPNGAPEGMAPSGVNDVIRQMMADIRTGTFAVVETIAALRAITNLAGQVFVLGFASAGDGGGGHYRYNSGSSAADNTGTIIQPTTGSGRWIYVNETGAPISVKQFGAVGNGSTNDTTPIQATVTAESSVWIPAGEYKITTKISVPAARTIRGCGRTARVEAWGVHAFEITGGSGDGVTIENLGIHSYDGAGVADPRLYKGIYCNGTSGNTVNRFTARELYMQGWASGIDWSYTLTSLADNVYTINTDIGIRYFGQSVNNNITNCKLVCNSGDSSIKLVPDGSTVGEGLMVTACVLASGNYGIYETGGFFSLQVSNCIIDLILVEGINLVDAKDTKIIGNWIYAAGKGIDLDALGSNVNEKIEIIGNSITLSGSTGTGVDVGGGNYGVKIAYNDFDLSGTEIGVLSDGRFIDITHNFFNNPGSGASIDIQSNIGYHNINQNHGTVTYGGGWGTWTPTDASGASLSLTTAGCTYETFGDTIVLYGDVTYPITVNGSNSVMGGLPFTTSNPCTGSLAIGYKTLTALSGIVGDNTTQIFLYDATGNRLTNANLSTIRFRFSCTYKRIWQ